MVYFRYSSIGRDSPTGEDHDEYNWEDNMLFRTTDLETLMTIRDKLIEFGLEEKISGEITLLNVNIENSSVKIYDLKDVKVYSDDQKNIAALIYKRIYGKPPRIIIE